MEYTISLDNTNNEIMIGVYLICYGGYHKWKCMQCPRRMSTDPNMLAWSKRIESIRKDIEKTFGVLKIRFKCLKYPNLFLNKHEIDN